MAASPVLPSSPWPALRAHPLLGRLPAPVLSRLLAQMDAVSFAPGQCLTREGEPAEALYLITGGQAERLGEGLGEGIGEGTPQAVLGANDLAGQAAAGLAHHVHTVRALTEVQAWRIDRAAVAQLCAAVPRLEARLIHSLSAQAPAPPDPPAATPAPAAEVSPRTLTGWALALVLPLLLFAVARAGGLSLQACIFIGIFAAVITMWVFSLVDEFVPPLLALVFMLFVGLAPPTVVLSSFASPSMMTLLGVFALAAMMTSSGLSNRVFLWLLLRLPNRPLWHQLSLILYGLLLSMGTPSGNNRISLMLPAFKDMHHGLRLAPRSAMATALFTATFAGAFIFSSTLATSKSATISVFGFLPVHLQDDYGGLFWLSAAALSTLVLLCGHLLASRRVFGDVGVAVVSRSLLADRLRLLGPPSAAEKVTASGFVLFLVGAMSTSVHHVSPAAVVGAVLIYLLVSGAMSKTDLQKNVDWPMIVFLISTDCLIKVMDYLGLSAQLAQSLQGLGAFVQGDTVRFIGLALVVVLGLRLFFPIPAGMLLSAVVLLPIAQSQGIHLWLCIFVIAVFADIWFFRYQASPYMIAVSAGVTELMDERAFLRHNQWMNGVRVLAVLLALPLWQAMGLA